MRKTATIAFLAVGAGLFVFGGFLSHQANQREETLLQMEENVQGRRRPIIGPIRRGVSAQAAQNAEQTLGQRAQAAAGSQVTAYWITGIGVALFFIGLGSLLFGKRTGSGQHH